jgi:hypothetical protein
MPNTGNKIFDNRRKWNVDITSPYIPSTPSDTYLSGTHSFSFQAYIERNCDIEIYLDGVALATSYSHIINYTFNGAVQTFPVTIGNIDPGYYNFRIKVVDLSNTYEYGAGIDINTSTEPNDLNGPFGPYFSPVYDGLTCPVGTITTTTTTTTTTSTTTTTTTAAVCNITGTVTGYVVPDITTTTTTTTTSTTTTTTTSITCPEAGTLLGEQCIGVDRWGTYADGSCGTYDDIIESNSPICGGGSLIALCQTSPLSSCDSYLLPPGATSCEDIGLITCGPVELPV